jgi:hypothetical protein
MFERTRQPVTTVVAVLTSLWTYPGCTNGEQMSASPQADSGPEISYSIEVPLDLPPGGEYKDKMNSIVWFTSEQIRQQYSSMHQRGWGECLVDLNREWRLEGKPIFMMQGYGWQGRGYSDGYSACQRRVRSIVERYGLQGAKQAVRKATENRRTRS